MDEKRWPDNSVEYYSAAEERTVDSHNKDESYMYSAK